MNYRIGVDETRQRRIAQTAKLLRVLGLIEHAVGVQSLHDWTPRKDGSVVRSIRAAKPKPNQPPYRNHPFPLSRKQIRYNVDGAAIYPKFVSVRVNGGTKRVQTECLLAAWYAANQGELQKSKDFGTYPELAFFLEDALREKGLTRLQ